MKNLYQQRKVVLQCNFLFSNVLLHQINLKTKKYENAIPFIKRKN
mgnify:CR=1 FL=1